MCVCVAVNRTNETDMGLFEPSYKGWNPDKLCVLESGSSNALGVECKIGAAHSRRCHHFMFCWTKSSNLGMQ